MRVERGVRVWKSESHFFPLVSLPVIGEVGVAIKHFRATEGDDPSSPFKRWKKFRLYRTPPEPRSLKTTGGWKNR